MVFTSPNISLSEGLPTLDRLNAVIPDELDVQKAANDWLGRFSAAVESKNVPAVLQTVHPDGWWRDLIALTWDIRTFHGTDTIHQFLTDRLTLTGFSVSNTNVLTAVLAKPYPDLQWIVTQFSFTTSTGTGVGTVFLVPTTSGEWTAFVLSTELDTVNGTKTHYGAGRDPTMGRADVWRAERSSEVAFEGRDPEVVIVGAGHAGLNVAARLKELGVSALVVEKHARVGDSWRKRYDSLRLHDFACT